MGDQGRLFSRPEYLISVDPGKTTGLFAVDLTGIESGHLSAELPAFDAVSWVSRMIDRTYVKHIVIERFVVTPQTLRVSRQYEAQEVTGAVKYLGWLADVPVSLQNRSSRTKVTNETLRKINWYRGVRGHADDAARHALVFAAKTAPSYPVVRRLLEMC